ncbi:hypothetical protein HMI54_004799 [Coelomomyces lativittatus]|nr:hypothetical protein HMI56_002276 [Coelomomyces lativittatus]KAJ1504321.1 hypothetical protein HMI55_002075 [Coelomomyces lativittatus]KAJ1517660.1 hypothetical protein HMI54_004799 [Coelomomyces lativittatus]
MELGGCNIRAIQKLSESELTSTSSASWHDQYKHSPVIFVGGFSSDLSEGDLLTVFSQYGEILNLHLVRDQNQGHRGTSKGFGFIKYEDVRSTILAVDNLNHALLLDKRLRVDHVLQYRSPPPSPFLDPKLLKYHAKYGGNVAPEVWLKSVQELEAMEEKETQFVHDDGPKREKKKRERNDVRDFPYSKEEGFKVKKEKRASSSALRKDEEKRHLTKKRSRSKHRYDRTPSEERKEKRKQTRSRSRSRSRNRRRSGRI